MPTIPDPNNTPGMQAVKPTGTPVANSSPVTGTPAPAPIPPTYNIPSTLSPATQQAVAAAMTANGGPQVNNKTFSGSGSVQQGQNSSTAVQSASAALAKPQPVPTYGDPVYDASGKQVGTAAFDPNTGAPLSKPATNPTVNPDGSFTLPSGAVVNADGTIKTPATGSATSTTPEAPTVVSQTAPDSSGGYTATYSNGTTAYVPPSPAVAGLYSQATSATQQETTSYNDQVNDATTAYNQQLQQLQEQMQNAQTAAEANYDTNNPEGSGSDKSEYASSVAKPFLEAIANLNADHQNNITDMADTHTANLQNIQTQLQSGIQTTIANTVSQGQSSYSEWQKSLAGDGTDDPTIGAQALLNANASNPAYTYQMALNEANSAIGKQTIATDKTLSTEDRANKTQSLDSFYKGIAQITTPFDDLMKTDSGVQAVSALAQQAIDGGLAKDVPSAMSLIQQMNKTSTATTLAQQKAQDAENNAITRLGIAADNAALNKTKVTGQQVKDDIKQTLTDNPTFFTDIKDDNDMANAVSNLAMLSGADPKTILGAISLMGKVVPPEVTKITQSPNFLQKILGGKQTVTTTKGSSDGSSNDSDPLGISTTSDSSNSNNDPLGLGIGQ